MKQKILISIVSLAVVCLCSCSQEKFIDRNKELTGHNFYSVTFNFRDSLKGSLQINNKERVIEIINSLNKCEVDGPYKGIGWDKITIEGSRFVQVLYSNGTVFSNVESGTFYKLSDDLKQYWK
jgi:hypothetical protein